jgi:hypothetical protein
MSGPRGFAYRSNGEMMSQGSVKDFNCFEYSGPAGSGPEILGSVSEPMIG